MRLDTEFNGNIEDDIYPSDFEEFSVEDVVWFYEALSEKEQNEFLHRIKKSKSTDPEEKIRELFDELNDETVMLLKELNEKFKSFEEIWQEMLLKELNEKFKSFEEIWQEIVKSINNIEA
ncbi:hypothetical protein B4O47_08800 [Campylobacter coli]|uniref:Uncharacterized protein n=1 Tax=Campylobacter coli TaxID=195 RepID=A0A624K2P4_CAMCO|nr:hypothetical protein [Campylobacter coli]EAL0373358.1 hypothetical protein [Campylobacter coli]EAL8169290.1 hypothetical protein [Campylobacter coli]ECZ6125341.1 hypothetical protein [Campylobacter coli]EDO9518960.1 hypothetical protein [Campylobacter coli]